MQNVPAAQVGFNCGVPVVQLPVIGVSSHLLTTKAEMDAFVGGQGAIGDYLAEIFTAYETDHFGWSKVFWDIATIGYLVDADWTPSTLVHSPIRTNQLTRRVDT